MTEYRFEVYDFAHYADEQHAKLAAMDVAGWDIHTAAISFTEVSILWQRGGKAGRKDKAEDTATLAAGFAGGAGLVPDPDEDGRPVELAELERESADDTRSGGRRHGKSGKGDA